MGAEAFRAGRVVLLGPPNAGKSTLLNRLLGQKLAIVTAKPQTTRSRILGVLTLDHAQMSLVDTPGLHTGERLLNARLNAQVHEARAQADVALLLVDRTGPFGNAHRELLEGLRRDGVEVLVVGTKLDAAPGRDWPPAELPGDVPAVSVSAQTGEGVDALLAEITRRLPESPPLYDPDTLTDRPVRWLAAELVREAAFEELEQELPYRLAVQVLEFDERREDLVRIRAQLLVERESQKRIAVGKGGAVVKRIGSRARREIEALVGCQVFLDLRVKVDPTWHKSERRIEAL
ncbi:MAG: GTPase Era, partial [Proteobacteria bacterium]|nr:GTPase Era [Pseudomonadota bacterium]